MEVATKEYIDKRLDRMERNIKQELLQALDQIGKPKRMTLEEVAENWGITKPVASKRLKEMYKAGKIENVDFDSRPITVDRKEFFQSLNKG